MRILIATDLYKPQINGVVTSAMNLKSGLEKLGHEVRVLALSNTKLSYSEKDAYFIGSYDASICYPNLRIKSKRTKKEVQNIIEWKPDIIHTQVEFSTFYISRKIAKKLNIPIVHTYHTMYEDYTHYFSPSKRVGRKAVTTGTHYVGNRVKCMIAPTTKILKVLDKYGVSCDTTVIPSGISLEKFAQEVSIEDIDKVKEACGISKDDFVMVSISRVGKEKNIDELVDKISKLKEKNISLVIVGDGPHKEELEVTVEKLGIADKVKFTGMVSPDEVLTYYKMADVFVSASTTETQGLTYIEALASGTPLLCRKDECLDGVLVDGFNGYSFESDEEFFEKLEKFMTSNDREIMSVNAKTDSNKFSIDVFAKSVESIYYTYLK
ncbi:MAG: glycosyltransferase family 4 protein [Clostridia bacterium]